MTATEVMRDFFFCTKICRLAQQLPSPSCYIQKGKESRFWGTGSDLSYFWPVAAQKKVDNTINKLRWITKCIFLNRINLHIRRNVRWVYYKIVSQMMDYARLKIVCTNRYLPMIRYHSQKPGTSVPNHDCFFPSICFPCLAMPLFPGYN